VSDADPQDLGLLPKLVIVFAVALIAAGVAWHGITFGVIERIWRNLFERSSGPLSFRFILQPSMAAIAAILDSVKTMRSGHVPYFWTFAHSPDKRVALLREGLNATARIILLGLAMDLIYQLIVFDTFHPVEALIIAVLLAYAPYLVVRALFTPIARRLRGGASAGETR
jgi:putative flippase GtrA